MRATCHVSKPCSSCLEPVYIEFYPFCRSFIEFYPFCRSFIEFYPICRSFIEFYPFCRSLFPCTIFSLTSQVRTHMLWRMCDVRWKIVPRVWQQTEHVCGKYCNARSDWSTHGKKEIIEELKLQTVQPSVIIENGRLGNCRESGPLSSRDFITHPLQVYCKFGCAESSSGKVYTGQGCTDKLRFSERKSHEAQCPWSIVPCPNSKECGSLLARDLTEHLISCVHAKCENSL